jgi:hypothetical protein
MRLARQVAIQYSAQSHPRAAVGAADGKLMEFLAVLAAAAVMREWEILQGVLAIHHQHHHHKATPAQVRHLRPMRAAAVDHQRSARLGHPAIWAAVLAHLIQ